MPSSKKAAKAAKSVAARVCAAKAEIQMVAKDGRHLKQGWEFASTDAIFETLRPILAKHDLDLNYEIEEFEIVQNQMKDRNGNPKAPWLKIKVRIGFAGEKWTHRHILHPVYGEGAPQAIGAAQSYVLRQYLRGRFQIATGDPEAEHVADGGASQAADIPATITAEQAAEISLIIADAGLNLEKFLEVGGVGRVEDLPASSYASAMRSLRRAAARQQAETAAAAEQTEAAE